MEAQGQLALGSLPANDYTMRAYEAIQAQPVLYRWACAARDRGDTFASWLASMVEMESFGLSLSKEFCAAVGRVSLVEPDRLEQLLFPVS